MNLSFFIARRYLVKQKGAFSSFIIRLAVVATALSVAVMIVAMAIVTGFKYAVTEKLYSFMGHVHVLPFDETNSNAMSYAEPVYYDPALMDKMKQLPHVAAVSPFVVRPVIVQAHGQMEGLQLKGVDSNYRFLKGISVWGKPVSFGDSGYARQIILSQTTA